MGIKISELTEASELKDNDVIALVDTDNEATKKFRLKKEIDFTKNIVEVGLARTRLTSTSETKVKFSAVNIKIGNKLTVDNNEDIIVGSGVSVVEVGYSLWFESGTTGRKCPSIDINGVRNKYWYHRFDTAPDFENIEVTAVLKVKEGDKISFGLAGANGDNINPDASSSFAYVRVVA